MEEQTTKRPFGLYAIMVLQLLSIVSSFFDFLSVQFGMMTPTLPNVLDQRILGIINLLVAALLVFVVWGLWRLKYWAWFSTMVLTGAGLIFGLWQYWHGGTPYIDLLINTLIVFYLNQRDLRQLFEDVTSTGVPA